ncbi:XdhC family protein [Catalinimonas sp. 4WD22]|uniref:XdhC family protein n=1 Tax=Catalinimonas locisalis TaxID=3133978 RepID=UPI0031010D5A
MKEIKAICEAYKKVDFSKHKAALATVVRVKGSSYRSPGARMLITDDGRWTGSISGGCLEGDALRKARKVMADKQAITVTYDTRDDENSIFKINLGCNGVIDVLFEAIDPVDKNNPVFLFERILQENEAASLATIFNGSPDMIGKKIYLQKALLNTQTIHHEVLSEIIEQDLWESMENKRSSAKTYEVEGEPCEVFIELIQPPIQLMIFGGGFDARPLSEMGKKLGWSVTVTDECVAHIAPLFFPDADNLSLCNREFIDRDFQISANTACVLMSHNYEYDRDVLKKILPSETPYIGILGPRKRFDKILKDFADQNLQLSEKDWDRIHAPIGLDIGAETPEEIAIAIIAEIMGRFTRREAGYLKFRPGPIHHRDNTSDQVFKEALL